MNRSEWPDLEKMMWFQTGYHEVIYKLLELKSETRTAEEFGNVVKGYLYGICDYKDMKLKYEEIKEKI